MNSKDKTHVACAANGILYLWKKLIEAADRNEPDELKRCWYRQDARQAYQDSIHCLMMVGLIEEYDVVKLQVKIDGVWTGAMRRVVS